MTINLDALFAPRNVVLVGASERNWSGRVYGNLQRLGYPGNVHLVNPSRRELWGRKCYPAMSDLPEGPDHLAVFVPAEQTIETMEAAGPLGARSASLFAAGFGEGGDVAGRDRASRLKQVLGRTGIAAVGPNCMGLSVGPARFATIPDEQLDMSPRGSVAIVTQSGMLIQTLSRGIQSGGGTLSYLISCGNQIGVTFADYVNRLSDDENIRVIACYIEALRDSPAFFQAARKASENGKTVVVTKIGGSEKSRRAALAHTGALAGSLQAFDVFAREHGVVRAETIEDLVESAIFLARSSRPAGRRIGLITNSGAIKSLATEAGEALGIAFAELSAATGDTIRAAIPDIEMSNPLDTKRTLSAEQYLALVQAVHDDPAVDMVLVAEELPRAAGLDRKLANLRALDSYIAAGASKPIVCFSPVTAQQTEYMLEMRGELPRITWLRDLNKTLRVASRLAPAAFATPIAGHPIGFSGVREKLASASAAAKPSLVLNEQVSKEILRSVGIATPREIVVPGMGIDEALAAACHIGFPVVLKVVTAAVAHKSDVGLVILDVKNEPELRHGLGLLQERCANLSICPEGVLIAEQIKGGVEVVVGMHRDPEVGPVIMFGAGGILLELLADVAFGPPGLDEARARDMILSTRVAKLLTGFRGSAACDLEALVRAVQGMGALAFEAGDLIDTAEINPLLVRPDGVYALDALIVVRREDEGT